MVCAKHGVIDLMSVLLSSSFDGKDAKAYSIVLCMVISRSVQQTREIENNFFRSKFCRIESLQ